MARFGCVLVGLAAANLLSPSCQETPKPPAAPIWFLFEARPRSKADSWTVRADGRYLLHSAGAWPEPLSSEADVEACVDAGLCCDGTLTAQNMATLDALLLEAAWHDYARDHVYAHRQPKYLLNLKGVRLELLSHDPKAFHPVKGFVRQFREVEHLNPKTQVLVRTMLDLMDELGRKCPWRSVRP